MENRKNKIQSLIDLSQNLSSKIEELAEQKSKVFSDLVREKLLYFLKNSSSTYDFDNNEIAFLVDNLINTFPKSICFIDSSKNYFITNINNTFIINATYKFNTIAEIKKAKDFPFYDDFISYISSNKNENIINNLTPLELKDIDKIFCPNISHQDVLDTSRKDFEKSLISSSIVEVYLSKSKTELKDIFGLHIPKMVGYNQDNPHHCFDLFEHTLTVVEKISTENLSIEEIILLKVAAFFHDIGKPLVAIKKENRTTYHGHPQKSAELARPILENLGYAEPFIRRVLFFIAHHDDFKDLKEFSTSTYISKYNKDLNIENLTNIIFENEKNILTEGTYLPTLQDYLLLINLCIADVSAQSRVAVMNDIVLDTRSNKIQKLKIIEKMLPEAYEKANKKSIFLLQNNMKNDSGIKTIVKNYANTILSGAKFKTSTPLAAKTLEDKYIISDLEAVLNVYGFKSSAFSDKLNFYIKDGKTNSQIQSYMSIIASRQNSFAINSVNNFYNTGDLIELLK